MIGLNISEESSYIVNSIKECKDIIDEALGGISKNKPELVMSLLQTLAIEKQNNILKEISLDLADIPRRITDIESAINNNQD